MLHSILLLYVLYFIIYKLVLIYYKLDIFITFFIQFSRLFIKILLFRECQSVTYIFTIYNTAKLDPYHAKFVSL